MFCFVVKNAFNLIYLFIIANPQPPRRRPSRPVLLLGQGKISVVIVEGERRNRMMVDELALTSNPFLIKTVCLALIDASPETIAED